MKMNNAAPAASRHFTSDGHFSTNTLRMYLSILKNGPLAGSPLGLFFYKVRERLSGRPLPLHHHGHCTHVSFTAVLGMDVF
jgi:hypothetical protein